MFGLPDSTVFAVGSAVVLVVVLLVIWALNFREAS
jgi:hypothetical protein